MSEKIKKKVFFIALVLTLLIFSIGMLMSYVLDSFRYVEVNKVIKTYEIDTEAYLLEKDFMDSIGQDKCSVMTNRFFDLKQEISEVGQALTKYKHRTFFTKIDFDYLKRHYFLLELKFFNLIDKLNKECDANYIILMFFYEKDDENSITQGYILSEISESYKNNVIIISLDKNYEDEPIVKLLVKRYNITDAPITIVNNNIRFEGLTYDAVISASINKEIKKADTDKFAKYFDFDYLFTNIGVNKDNYIENLNIQLNSQLNKQINTISSNFAKADMLFVLGRLTNNYSLQCEALQYFDNAISENTINTRDEELNAIIYESIAAIGCGRNKKAFLELASQSWKNVGNIARADIDYKLANNLPLDIQFETSLPESSLHIPENSESINSITFGKSKLILKSGDTIASQTDRVTRDWLTYMINQSPYGNNILTIFSEKLNYDDLSEEGADEELMPDIGWHEGARIKEITSAGIKNLPLSGTMVIKNKEDNKWYAPNEKGIFMFEVPFDKIMYPTTRFLRENIAVIIDTHGINMLVEQAVRYNQRNTKNKIKAVIACGDHPGKAKAALYLSKKGITSIVLPDKYSYLALGHDAKILPSPPIKINENNLLNENKVIIGDQPITIDKNQKIIVMNATNIPYAVWYYQTPTNYFTELEKYINLNAVYITINDFNQTDKIITAAQNQNADIIAARVFNSYDYNVIKEWLLISNNHKAILFHSAPYPYGYKILKEFPKQVTFGDVNPIFNDNYNHNNIIKIKFD